MQGMMNDTAELTTEENSGDILPVVLNEEVQPEEQEKSELDKLKEELSAVTYDDILNSTAPYEKILTLPDEFAVSQYIADKYSGVQLCGMIVIILVKCAAT